MHLGQFLVMDRVVVTGVALGGGSSVGTGAPATQHAQAACTMVDARLVAGGCTIQVAGYGWDHELGAQC